MSSFEKSAVYSFDFDCFHNQSSSFSHFISNIFTYTFIGLLQYILICTVFELRNPMPKCKLRIDNMKKEIKLGVFQIFCQGVYSMTFYHYIYPHTKWYRYFDINSFDLWSFAYGMIFLYIWTSFFGYWVHRMFHIRGLYKWVHSVHHQFKEPTPFGYCATHPIEGLTEVSTVLHVAELLIPIHPLMTLFFFEYITIHEIMGHDGGYSNQLSREFDDADHYRHHLYYVVNYGDAIMDKYFGTTYQSVMCHYMIERLSSESKMQLYGEYQ